MADIGKGGAPIFASLHGLKYRLTRAFQLFRLRLSRIGGHCEIHD